MDLPPDGVEIDAKEATGGGIRSDSVELQSLVCLDPEDVPYAKGTVGSAVEWVAYALSNEGILNWLKRARCFIDRRLKHEKKSPPICLRCLLAVSGFACLLTFLHLNDSKKWNLVSTGICDKENGLITNMTKDSPRWPRRYDLSPYQTVNSINYNPYWLVVSRRLKVAVNIVPKVMCTSIRTAMNNLECDSKQRCAEARLSKELRSIDLTNYTRIVMFRDPFERLYSAYKNSIENRFIVLKKCQNSKQCTFTQWVDEMFGTGKHFQNNEHFTLQSKIAQLGNKGSINYHYYLRMSSPVDVNFFWSHILRQDPVHKNPSLKTNKNQSTTNDVLDFFKAQPFGLLEKIAYMYQLDLELWGKLLIHGTPRHDETTVYDYFQEETMRQGFDESKTV